MDGQAFTRVPTSALKVGTKLGAPIFDQKQTKLIAAGMKLTAPMLDRLHERLIDSVVVSIGDFARMQSFKPQGRARHAVADRAAPLVQHRNVESDFLDTQSKGKKTGPIVGTGEKFSDRMRKPEPVSYAPGLLEHLTERTEQRLSQLETLADNCMKKAELDLNTTKEVTRESLEGIKNDIDSMICLAGNPCGFSYPMRHSFHTAMLATAMGTNLGLNEQELMDLGIGCLIHDIGMLRVQSSIREARRKLSDDEYAEIARHPLHTLDMLQDSTHRLSLASRMIAYQMHERIDGGGYPRKSNIDEIHPLARLASVADTYLALVSPRPHRAGMMSYCAMELMIRKASQGQFDPAAVRALVQTVGLFPIGSYVSLSHQWLGRVIRVRSNNYTQPVVEVWRPSNLQATPAIVDLSQDSTLKIERPLVALSRNG
ncbi:MAG: Cyclic di-GMP phosphodiesterase response regulator RpfG [Planctomycetota bacterium]